VFIVPLKFLFERLLVLSCLQVEANSEQAHIVENGRKAMQFSAYSSKKKSIKKASKKAPDESFSKKQVAPLSNMDEVSDTGTSYSERIQASGGLSKKNRAVSFKSSKVDLEKDDYGNTLDAPKGAEFSISTKFSQYVAKYTYTKSLQQRIVEYYSSLKRRIATSSIVVWVRLKYVVLIHRCFAKKVRCYSFFFNTVVK
jgi:hypothetical protein